MKKSMQLKLESLAERFAEVTALLSEQEVIAEQNRFRELSMEYSQLEPISKTWDNYQDALASLVEAQAMLTEDDKEMREMAQLEISELEQQIKQAEAELQTHLIPKDPHDTANIFLEIRAGTGGDEAALFAGALFRMYNRYADTKRWQVEIMSQSEGEHGGFKEVIARISGKRVYSRLKFESGAHRVQRVPETESQGRVHTSAATVAIIPEPDEVEQIEINPSDLRVDTFRASGAGGQHVNKTDSAVRLTHLPTGVVVECQDGRSQHKNKARAMSVLQARLMDAELQKQHGEESAMRKSLVGSGDRSERIRTYNYPQGRVTDHRINLTLYKLDEIVSGDLDQVIEPLITEHQAELLTELGNDE